MQNSIKERLVYELLNSQVLLNREGLGHRSSLLWQYETLFPPRAFNEMEIEDQFVPQGIWTIAPDELMDDSTLTEYTITLTASDELRDFQYVYRTNYKSSPQTIDRVNLDQTFAGANSTVYVYTSLDGNEWTLVYTGDTLTTGQQMLASPVQCNFVLFKYHIKGNKIAPFGSLTIRLAQALNGLTPFVPEDDAGIGLRGVNLVSDGISGGLTDENGEMFNLGNPAADCLNIFDYPYSNDTRGARPAVYLGAFDYESTDRLEYQSVSSEGIAQMRYLVVPLVVCTIGDSHRQAIYRRDVLRAKIRRILMQVPITELWYLLEASGDKQDSAETCICTGTAGANSTGIWEATCVIPVVIHYRLETTGELRP